MAVAVRVADLRNKQPNNDRDFGGIPSAFYNLVEPPVEVEDDSIVFRPGLMRQGKFYVVELHGKPYLYRRVNATEVEVYGMVEEAS